MNDTEASAPAAAFTMTGLLIGLRAPFIRADGGPVLGLLAAGADIGGP